MEKGLCEQHDADQAAPHHENPESDWTDISVDNFAPRSVMRPISAFAVNAHRRLLASSEGGVLPLGPKIDLETQAGLLRTPDLPP
jgi:hypothetical protein